MFSLRYRMQRITVVMQAVKNPLLGVTPWIPQYDGNAVISPSAVSAVVVLTVDM
jgi:hypothetical protein